jgi:hypothetical protein
MSEMAGNNSAGVVRLISMPALSRSRNQKKRVSLIEAHPLSLH